MRWFARIKNSHAATLAVAIPPVDAHAVSRGEPHTLTLDYNVALPKCDPTTGSAGSAPQLSQP